MKAVPSLKNAIFKDGKGDWLQKGGEQVVDRTNYPVK